LGQGRLEGRLLRRPGGVLTGGPGNPVAVDRSGRCRRPQRDAIAGIAGGATPAPTGGEDRAPDDFLRRLDLFSVRVENDIVKVDTRAPIRRSAFDPSQVTRG
jgi:hypothetical protein